ncbi:Transport permease protein OS=Tsukamurella paurometabola (strain ATCC 8368 / DSM / CCUG 35730/ CIP 100753 / JCM 10117 / KCTC 9821 / NBRC 16120 / NCIMB 702349 / NCTC 13040) OX=521096 GN=Tpau_4327 PE=3 SV=1 [Tsukamurella paurometabola]|uniref:Transport permease protein n=1 Tax=Tsukamurella paurometabola (strain ATCC 8368 / DSM 20162 / CCUG 35730 / CIP 100753 / JCM 10117 / KCTC 9821 / NBRC 16120 / NCIMB 702349 / NCTC 13040) TaxID=521096 RepID=D5UZ41_TSUPD|nr:ABC transporter permease [Tsukamurella paurometabola]ADG80888.1 ABC-2 type transporter [Tsukamurella paurometabola DSM 20162]SUQ39254.1 Daunorubicin/doxorubicin resistance ABC transporter permease protein drrB [Tsukamurella paurometabola]
MSTRSGTTSGTVTVDRRAVPLAPATLVVAGALLRAWSRSPVVLVQAIAFPAFLLAMFQLVLGKTVTAMGAGTSIYANAGLIALVSALYGSLATGLSFITERESGVLSRHATMPVPRAALLAGRLVAEAGRTAVSTALLLAMAVVLGLRFTQGPLAAAAAYLVPIAFGTAFALVVLALAAVTAGTQMVQLFGGVFLLLMFFGTGFVPADQYPVWLQPIVRWQPLSPATDLMRGLTEGGPVAVPLLATALWIAGILAFAFPVALRGFAGAAVRR